MSSGVRVSIPNSVRTTVQNIKEIIGNHSEEEIYAMLKECSMDPNETAQKLLLQDPYHEVKRKRGRRKENLSNKESVESRWKSGMQGRGSRAGRGNYAARFSANDGNGGRNTMPVRENGINQVSEKGVGLSSLPISQEAKHKEITPATSSLVTNGPTMMTAGSTGVVHAVDLSGENLANKSEQSSAIDISKLGGPPCLPHLANAKENPSIEFGTGSKHEKLPSSSSNDSTTGTQPSPGIYFLGSDPVLVPSHDSLLPGVMDAIKREVGSQRTPAEQISLARSEGKSTAAASEVGSSSVQGQMPSKSREVGNNQLSEYAQPASSSHGGASVIRPLSNYNSRLQQVIGPQKVGHTKEWKPKPTNLNLVQGSGTAGTSAVPTAAKANEQTCPVSSALDSKEDTSKLQRNLEELHISDGQHVIIPNHLHVPEAEKVGFCFGSFDASFDLSTGYNSAPENDMMRTSLSETSESVAESAEEPSSQNALSTTEGGDYPDHPPSPRYVPENLSSGEGDVSSNVVPEHCEPKQENAMPPGSHQFSVVHTSPSYNFGFMPPTVGSQLAQSESSESQTLDVSRFPSFVVPQPIDPGSYYAQFYLSTADSDGRISPFNSLGVTTKYNGNLALLSPQTSQSAQEGGNSVLLSTAGPTPLVTQAAGLMQSSIPVTQQPIPVFRQPTGMTIPHYSPNYIPYGHYFSPLYVPHPALHQFLSHGAFPQLPQAGSIYPATPGTTAKYPVTQFKVGTNTGNSTHVGVVGSYGLYGSSPASYNPSSASTVGNSTANEDLTTPQFKESNVYVTGQQTEGSAVWIAAPGRDIPGLKASSFYSLPAQGQVTFTPTQASHGTFTGMYHPAHAVSATTVHPLLQQSQTIAAAVDVVGPAANVYQQHQHSQINWPNNY